MKLIELHILQSFSAPCLNSTTPQLTYFGDVLRAKISGNYWKQTTYVVMKTLIKHHFNDSRIDSLEQLTNKTAIFSPAVSTHKVPNDVDYFAAVDATPETLEPNTTCFYRYIGLNWNWFAEYLENLKVPPNDILRIFLRSAICAAPSAPQSSVCRQTLPSYILGLTRNGNPLSLINAFETPLPPRADYLEPSYETMKKYFKLLKQSYKELYADRTRTEVWLKANPVEPQPTLDDFINQLSTTLK